MATRRSATTTLLLRWQYSTLVLCVAVFILAVVSTILLTASPWRVVRLGGKSFAVGAVFGVYMGSYLVTCLLLRPHADRLGAKRLVMSGVLAFSVLMALLAWAPSVWTLLLVIGLCGCVGGACLWPPLMGWVSAGKRGAKLNRAMAWFSFSWASGGIAGALIGGILFEIRQWLPFVIAAVALLLLFGLVCSARRRRTEGKADDTTADAPRHARRRTALVHMSMVALLLTHGPIFGSRALLPSLIDQMSLGANLYGRIMAGMGLTMTTCFFVLGRTVRWHHRPEFLLSMQATAVVALIALAGSETPVAIAVFTIAMMPVFVLIYSSHLFYRIASGAGRTASTATHEIFLSLGMCTGSFGAGALGEWIGIRQAFYWLAGLIVVSMAVQVLLWLCGPASDTQDPPGEDATT